jgi:hypothetical protein
MFKPDEEEVLCVLGVVEEVDGVLVEGVVDVVEFDELLPLLLDRSSLRRSSSREREPR